MITRMDRYIGNVLRLLDELNLAEDTIVIFSSDNGTTHLKLEVDYDFFESVGELRGLKGSLYEGGIRVPCIVRWPQHVEAGSSSDHVSGFEDWTPTVLELIGAPKTTTEETDGLSFAPALLGQEQTSKPFLYREFSGYGGQQSIRVGDWKAIRTKMNRGNTKVELYDLASDVAEEHDVSEDHPNRTEQMTAMMMEEHEASELYPLRPFDVPAIKPKTSPVQPVK